MANPFEYPIRLVVLDYPIQSWKNPEVQSMFSKVVDLKLTGYWDSHGHDKVIPVDVSDFIGANIITCYDTPEGLKPIMAFRMLTLSRCELHRNRFPALSVLESSGVSTAPVEAILESVRKRARDVVYASSWTRASNLPKSPEAKRFLRDLHTSNILNFMDSRGIDEFIACSVLKFRVNEHFEYCGMKPITQPFAQYSVFDQIVTMYHLDDFANFTAEARADRERMKLYWARRIELATVGAISNDVTGEISTVSGANGKKKVA
jgi:hypothetical protein